MNFTGITLQQLSSGGMTFTLTDGTAVSADTHSLVLEITFSPDDLRDIKIEPNLAVSRFTSHLSVSSLAFSDPAGNEIQPVLSTAAMRAAVFIDDLTGPRLLNYTLNITGETILFTFDDPVNVASLNPTEITLQSVPDSSDAESVSYTLTSGTAVNIDNYEVQLNINRVDLNEIKARTNLATERNNTYLSALGTTVSDLFGNPLQQIVPTQALQAAEFVGDIIAPRLVEYSLDLNMGALILSFSETVNISNFRASQVTLQSVSNSSLPDAITLALSAEGNVVPNTSASAFTYFLDNTDLNFLKERPLIGNDSNDTFLSLTSLTISDMVGNSVIAISSETALQTADHIVDLSPPTVSSVSFDLNTGTLSLSFSESVLASSVVPANFFISSSQAAGSTEYRLTGGNVSTVDGPEISINLTTSDLNMLKQFTGLATNVNNTFLRFFSDSVTDLSDNPIAAITLANAIPASSVTPDTVRPILDAFTLNLNSASLILTFSETVNASSLNASSFTLQSVMDVQVSPTVTTLTLGDSPSVTPDYSPVITFKLNLNDITALQKNPSFGTDVSNTFLRVQAGAILDVSNNDVEAVLLNNALPAAMVVPDTTAPQLLNYTFDLNTGSIVLTFSEVITVSSILPTEITLQSDSISTAPILQLSDDATVSGSDDRIVNITLVNSDLNTIKQALAFGTGITNTFISYTESAFNDTSGNRVQSIPVFSATQASNFTADTTPPELTGFDLITSGTCTQRRICTFPKLSSRPR